MRLAVSMLHDEDDARDAVQEVFLRLWESDSAIDNRQAFILRAVRNTCLNRIAATDTRERFRRRFPLDETDTADDPPVDDEELHRALSTLLSPRERQVIDRIYSEGMSYKEAAQNMEVSVALVNKNIVSALKKLRAHFKTRKT